MRDGKGQVVANLQYAEEEPEYLRRLRESEKSGECIFCHPEKLENLVFEREGEASQRLMVINGWFAKQRDWPGKGRDTETPTAAYFLLIPERHILRFEELTREDWEAVRTWVRWLIREIQIPGGTVGFRFNDPAFSGGTIYHFHVHIIQPGVNPETGKVDPFAFWVG